MNIDFQFREKIPVTILGATGTVGQQFVALLSNHPWFEIVSLTGSERSIGKPYQDAVHWLQPTPVDPLIAPIIVSASEPHPRAVIAFSALDASVAESVETAYAEAGSIVISNASAHRMREDVPLLIPDINPDHLERLSLQKTKGKIVTNPNCTATGLTLALKPLHDHFGLQSAHVVTFQAISGAGYPGVSAYDILDNVIPYIAGEEEKIRTEPLKILGDPSIIISAQCNRAPLTDGHLECVSVKLKKKASTDEIIAAWNNYQGEAQALKLPTAPLQPIHYRGNKDYPQPRYQKMRGKGMAVSIGQLRSSGNFDYQFTLLTHNTIRGAAGGAILNAELMVKKGFVYW